MRLSVAFAASLLLLSSAGPLLAQNATATATSAPATAEDPDRIVCHMSAAPTGTRLGKSRECHTQRQWDEMRQQEQQSVNDMQSSGLRNGVPGG
jgi:hypothetical protein